MNIGLFGGSFSPPHFGHLWIIKQVLDCTDCEAVWLMPCYGHTFQKNSVSARDRLAMTEGFVEDIKYIDNYLSGKVFVSDVEIKNRLSGATIDVLGYLPKEHTYRFIIGTDQLPTFHLWTRYEELLEKLPFLVFPRYGYPNEPLFGGMTMVSDESLIVSNISSTKIRKRVQEKRSIYSFTTNSVIEYIQKHNLYSTHEQLQKNS